MQTRPLNEEVFLAQLSSRAVLLNTAFQNSIVDLLMSHSASDSDIIAGGADYMSHHHLEDTFESIRSQRLSNVLKSKQEMCNKTLVGSQGERSTIESGDRSQLSLNYNPNMIRCKFDEGVGVVEIHNAPIKSLSRMREKLLEYMLPSPKGVWPLTANILDPVRLSLVTNGPSHIRQLVRWFLEKPGAFGFTVCRLKNAFALPRSLVHDGYRDVKLFVIFSGPGDLKIIGEIQIHDREMHKLKQQMHHLYRVKRAHGPDLI